MSCLRKISSSSLAQPAAVRPSSDAQPASTFPTDTPAKLAGSQDREKMAEVIVGLKVMPKTVETDLDKLEEKIRAAIDPDKISREPIAFGLVAFHVVKLVPDAGGQVDELESKLKAIEEVGEVEVTGISRGL